MTRVLTDTAPSSQTLHGDFGQTLYRLQITEGELQLADPSHCPERVTPTLQRMLLMASLSKDGQPRILVIDGNERTAELLRRFLVEEECNPTVVTTLDAANELLDESMQFACAVVDIDRFDRPVWEYCQQLHDHEVPFIVLSEVRNRSLRRESREHGARSFVEKPVPQQEFRVLIENALSTDS